MFTGGRAASSLRARAHTRTLPSFRQMMAGAFVGGHGHGGQKGSRNFVVTKKEGGSQAGNVSSEGRKRNRTEAEVAEAKVRDLNRIFSSLCCVCLQQNHMASVNRPADGRKMCCRRLRVEQKSRFHSQQAAAQRHQGANQTSARANCQARRREIRS